MNNAKWRVCVDYRCLNDQPVKFALPSPRCDEVVSQVGGAKYLTTLDLRFGFLLTENDPHTAEYSGLTIPGLHYHFAVLPFGVANIVAFSDALGGLCSTGYTVYTHWAVLMKLS
jgi:hypothetical protein